MYLLIKNVHVSAVVLSLSFFAIRGAWMLMDSPLLGKRWAYWVPQLIDTVLLVSAITLAVMLQQYPFVHGWLTAKVLALLAYIVLGSIALRRGPTRTIRTAALVAALSCAAYIVWVALSHDPLPWR